MTAPAEPDDLLFEAFAEGFYAPMALREEFFSFLGPAERGAEPTEAELATGRANLAWKVVHAKNALGKLPPLSAADRARLLKPYKSYGGGPGHVALQVGPPGKRTPGGYVTRDEALAAAGPIADAIGRKRKAEDR